MVPHIHIDFFRSVERFAHLSFKFKKICLISLMKMLDLLCYLQAICTYLLLDIFLELDSCLFLSCRRGSGPRTCQSDPLGGAAASCVSVLWTFRTASGRKPADVSWQPNELLLSDRTRPQRGQTALRSTSPKPRRDSEVRRFLLNSSGPPPPTCSLHIQPHPYCPTHP